MPRVFSCRRRRSRPAEALLNPRGGRVAARGRGEKRGCGHGACWCAAREGAGALSFAPSFSVSLSLSLSCSGSAAILALLLLFRGGSSWKRLLRHQRAGAALSRRLSPAAGAAATASRTPRPRPVKGRRLLRRMRGRCCGGTGRTNAGKGAARVMGARRPEGGAAAERRLAAAGARGESRGAACCERRCGVGTHGRFGRRRTCLLRGGGDKPVPRYPPALIRSGL